ncbi:MAG: hypothetical protein Q9162_004740 [Coniocarpon cinnabarinum]
MDDSYIPPPSRRSDFEIAILCALRVEFDAVEAAFDISWEEHFKYSKAPGDPNAYSTGAVCGHNVVLAFMPGIGKVNAANVASGLRSSFPALKLGLIVGVCGVSPIAWETKQEIVLGDVTISTEAVQSDFGREYSDGIQIKSTLQDSLSRPNSEIRALLQKLSSKRASKALSKDTSIFLEQILSQEGFEESQYPGAKEDKLFDPKERHKHRSDAGCAICSKCENDYDEVCDDALRMACANLRCNEEMLVKRERLRQPQDVFALKPCIHLGRIASADQTLKSAPRRDKLARDMKVIAFEMEGAGSWETLPTVIIKGACDYADSHKAKKWQNYAAVSAAACMKALLKQWTATDRQYDRQRTGPQGVAEESFSIVFDLSEVSETDHFVARQKELDVMYKTLSEGEGRRAVTLHGLGGIGKTQLAIAYAKAHRNDYSAIFWLNVKDEASILQGYSHIATQILKQHPSVGLLKNITDETKLSNVFEAVKRWLEHPKNTQWLMIFDNYDNPKISGNTDNSAIDIQQFLPKVYHGAIVVTTISSKVNVGRRMQISKLEGLRDSLQILSDASHRDDVFDDSAATELVKELDGHPLALATAGAYLNEVSTSFASYIQLYKSSWLKLQQKSPELSSYEDKKLFSTWNVSLSRIRQQNEHSAKLLQLWAYFDNQDLWLELLREGRSSGLDWLLNITEDELNFDEALRMLCNYGLAGVDRSAKFSEVEHQGYTIHSCVHSWAFHMLNKEWDPEFANLTLKCVARHLPDNNMQKPWVTQRRLMRHIGRCWRFVLEGCLDHNDTGWMLHRFGDVYADQGQFKEAEAMYQRALQGKEKAWGPEHTSTLNTVNNLGNLYADLRRLEEAERMYQRALQGKEKAWGLEHTSTLDTVNNLGSLYADLGRLEEAERMYQRALQGYKKALGRETVKTFVPALSTAENLANLVARKGRAQEADALYSYTLVGVRAVFGSSSRRCQELVKALDVLRSNTCESTP